MLLQCTFSAIAEERNPDPWERSNRGVYAFNDFLDRNFLSPLAYGYDYITPGFVQTGFRNFFNNLGEPVTVLNDALQLKTVDFYRTIGRFTINSVIGIGGILDIAKFIGLHRHSEDLGQTLGYWGVGAGPYAVLPFLGPSTTRDTLPIILSLIYGRQLLVLPLGQAEENVLLLINIVDARNRLRAREGLIVGDEYTFIRDAYLQNRRYQVLDGNLPLTDALLDEDWEDLEELEGLDRLDEIDEN